MEQEGPEKKAIQDSFESEKRKSKKKMMEDPSESKRSPKLEISIIDEENHAKYHVDCNTEDTIWDLKVSIYHLRGINAKYQRLVHRGYDLSKDAARLSDYKIEPKDFIDLFVIQPEGNSKLPQDSGEPESSEKEDFQSDSFFMSESTAFERIQFWHHKASLGHYDADTHIVDPLAHHDHLNYLENYVVQHSEYFRCKGQYDFQDENFVIGDESRIPDEAWKVVLMIEANFLRTSIPSQGSSSHSIEDDVHRTESFRITRDRVISLRKSYGILSRVLASFKHLRKLYFCTNFYSMLAEHPSKNDIAELVPISEEKLREWNFRIENSLHEITSITSKIPENITRLLKRTIAPICDEILSTIHLPAGNGAHRSQNSTLTTFRMAVLILDLALVAYTGSHGSRFDKRFIGSKSERLQIRSQDKGLPVLTCTLRPLKCLSEFLDNEKMWVFGFEDDQHNSQPVEEPPKLSILTRIETFADVWGPVWGLSAGDKFSKNVFQQYNLSRGCIYPVSGSSKIRIAGLDAVVCHWNQFLIPMDEEHAPKGQSYLHRGDMLLIGANLWHNGGCQYRLSHYAEDYGTGFAPLGTARPEWRPETWTVGMTAGQYVTVNANMTKKKYPGTTHKENIWAKFKLDPKDANISYLNDFLGVEISHCSGNARRVRLKDLFLLRRVKARLNDYRPNWETTNWGQLFSNALADNNFATMENVWNNEDNRENIADIICKLLWDLNHTGERHPHFVAAFYNRPRPEKQVELQIQKNTWGKSLRDSTLVATYAVIGDKCLKYLPTNDPGTAMTCRNEIAATRTVLQTTLKFRSSRPAENDYVKIGEFGALFRVRSLERDINNKRQIILAPATATVVVPTITADEVMEDIGRRARGSSRVYQAIIRAQTPSYGGSTSRFPLVFAYFKRQTSIRNARWRILDTGKDHGSMKRLTIQIRIAATIVAVTVVAVVAANEVRLAGS